MWHNDGRRVFGLVKSGRIYKGRIDKLVLHPVVDKVSIEASVAEIEKLIR